MGSIEKPRLFHAPSSYYSMIARLALAEARLDYEPIFVDIHARMSQQSPDYARLNFSMSVPALVMPGCSLDDSRLIAEFAFGVRGAQLNADTKYWLDLQYSFPVEDLTVGGLLARNPVARLLIPKTLAKAHQHLLEMAVAHPDLADAYRNRAAVFAQRVRTLDPRKSLQLWEKRRHEAIVLLEQLNSQLFQNAVIVPPTYGIADVVWTVFLGRMVFVGMSAEIGKRPPLARYWSAVQARPSFAAADIWTKLHLSRLIGGIFGFHRLASRDAQTIQT